MAEQSSTMSDVLDVALPAFAFLASASGRYGAAGAQALLAAMQMRERGKYRKDERQRYQDAVRLKEQQAALALPGQQLEAAQAGFQLGNLRDVVAQLREPTATREAVQALGEPTALRLQEALQRGEQVPLPQEEPSAALQQQRLGQLATTPQGAAQLQAAGLGGIPTAATHVQQEQRQRLTQGRTEAREQRQEAKEFGQEKRQALGMIQNLPPNFLQGEQFSRIRQSIKGATTQEELTEALAMIPQGAGAQKGSVEEQVFRELAPKFGPLQALGMMSQAKAKKDTPEEAQERQLRMQKLQEEIKGKRRESSGMLSPGDQRKLQLDVRRDIRSEPIYKDGYLPVLTAHTTMRNGFDLQNAQGDVAMITAFARLTDPGSVVRPSEYQIAINSQGWADSAKMWLERIKSGEVLADRTRKQFMEIGDNILNSYAGMSKTEIEQIYGSAIKDTGLSMDDIFVQPQRSAQKGQVSVGPTTPAAPALPAVPDLSTVTPADLPKLTPQQLDELEKRLKGQ